MLSLLMSVLIAAELYQSTMDISIHICVESSQTVLEHHRSFIPSTLVSQLEEKTTQGSHWESNPGPSALAVGGLTTEPRLLISTQAISLQL